jgi:hypothetical protein
MLGIGASDPSARGRGYCSIQDTPLDAAFSPRADQEIIVCESMAGVARGMVDIRAQRPLMRVVTAAASATVGRNTLV